MWFGWILDAGTWQRVTGPHETLSACCRALDRLGVERGIPGRHQVMTGGAAPRLAQETRSTPRTVRRSIATEETI